MSDIIFFNFTKFNQIGSIIIYFSITIVEVEPHVQVLHLISNPLLQSASYSKHENFPIPAL